MYKHSGSSGIGAPVGERIQEDVGVSSLKEILVIGSANVDPVIGAQQAPELGETVPCCSFRKTCGERGANQAYACGRLDGDVAFLNAMGDDPLGGGLARNLQQANVDTRVTRTVNGVSTGMAVVCMDEKGNNSIIVVPGANNLCDVDCLRRNRARFEESDAVLLQMEILFESVCYVVELASGLHKTAVLNPAPASDNLSGEVYTGLDYLTPNESELKRLTGCLTDEVEELAVHCKPLLEKRTRNIIITLGGRGALHVNREGHTLYRPPEVQVVDTTAAGDTFSAALARELADGRSIGEAIVFANMAFALAASRVGVQDSVPSYEEALDFKKRMERVRMSDIIVKTIRLCVDLKVKDWMVRAVNRVSLSLERGKTLVILGESGSGKSTYMKTLPRILLKTAVVEGQAEFPGNDLFRMSKKELRDVWGNRMAMICQDSLFTLDPMYKVGYQIVETIRAHSSLTKVEARERVEELLVKVGIPSLRKRVNAYPHKMSSGMRQRVVIVTVLCCNPCLLLAGGPITALSVTIQKQILGLSLELQESDHMPIMMVTHDIGVAAQVVDQIAIMYGGIILECGVTRQVLETPVSPYTKALIVAPLKNGNRERPVAIEGQPSTIVHMPPGCPFPNRCVYVTEACRQSVPELKPIDEHYMTACHMNLVTSGDK